MKLDVNISNFPVGHQRFLYTGWLKTTGTDGTAETSVDNGPWSTGEVDTGGGWFPIRMNSFQRAPR